MPLDTAFSVCPHDCPSTCALDVDRLAPDRIGKITGADGNRYTAGVVCAKVARYAERVHHPGRLTHPQRRTGSKGDGAFEAISWDDALDELAEAFTAAAQRDGLESVWPYNYAGTMGLVQRDGINRLRNVMGYSRQASTICSTLSAMGWIAGAGTRRGPDIEELTQSDLIVVWGTNPVHTQVNLMHHIARARKERGARLVVVDPYRTATAATADLHIAPRPGTDGALACAVMHVLFR
ncbi:MAG: molybdopterin-dependent oxidoreductase, partial [Rhodospirillales bacterium]|nr:molybdopterin-dependent oxidoreductase [Rhodospirillales bacterium]